MSNSLDRATLWTRMQYLLENLRSRVDSTTFADEFLDMLVDLFKANRGIILVRMSSKTWSPIAVRQRRRTVRLDTIDELRTELLDPAIRAGRATVHTGTDEPTIVTVPLRRGAWHSGNGLRSLGIVYLELSNAIEVDANPLHLEFLDSAAVLVSVTLDQRARLETIQEDLRRAKTHDHIDQGPSLEEILDSESMQELRDDVRACVIGDSSIMILGESGTGKTRLAAAIAQASARTPIVRATLGASDDLNTITSELFGHERGAYSGAVTSRKGLVEYADGGTLILDEILNLPPHAQQLLLDFTQFGTYRPLGYPGKEPKSAVVRIIAATNGSIRQAIADTRFRQDLYFRLAGVTVTLPTLRHRRHEVPGLAQQYLRRLDPARAWRLSAAARRLLLSEAWEWEGNIRQLQSVIRRARDRALAAEASDFVLEASYIGRPTRSEIAPLSIASSIPPPVEERLPAVRSDRACDEPSNNGSVEERWFDLQTRRSTLDEIERELIDQAMKENRGIVSHAARTLRISRTSLISRMTTLRMDRNKYRR